MIRIGCFDDFKGANVVLLDIDAAGLSDLAAWARSMSRGGAPRELSQLPTVRTNHGCHVVGEVSEQDTGMARSEDGTFVWRRTPDGWADVGSKLDALRSGAGHQYLEASADEIIPVASKGEYDDAWWAEQAG